MRFIDVIPSRAVALQVGLAVLLPVMILVSLSTGTIDLSFQDALRGLFGGSVESGVVAAPAEMIVQRIRLPRALLAAFVGAVLAVCGAVTQGLFRNPLADPSLIGVTAGASLGAALIIFALGQVVGVLGAVLISVGAFFGGLLSVVLVYRLATGPRGTSVATMLLAGIAITALVGALGNLLELYSSDETLRRISLWRMGALDGANGVSVLVAGAVCVVVVLPLSRYAKALDAMLLGESEARYLGIQVDRVKSVLIVLVAVGVGASVALAGTIAFVGLVVPHVARLLVGPGHRHLIRVSALLGASLLVVADTLARTVVSPSELPVGVVTALIGAPFFVSLLRRRDQYGIS